MDPVQSKLQELEDKINKIFISVEKTRRYFLWTMIITVVAFVLPLIGLAFAIPKYLNTLTNMQGF